MFGLTVTEYPELARTKKELGLLQKLYGLYNAVIDGVNGYYDILWIEVDIEKINNELLDFQNRCCMSIVLSYCYCLHQRIFDRKKCDGKGFKGQGLQYQEYFVNL